jgi:hypothetical protein
MTLNHQLKEMIEDYFSKYPNTSINSLALKTNVGATTLRRILAETIKGDPSPHTVLAIVSALAKEKKLAKLVEKIQGPVGDMLRETYRDYVELESPHVIDVDLNELLRDRVSYFVYKLAANKTGVSEFEVVELFGAVGRERLQKLLECQVLERQSNTVGERYHAREKNFALNIEVASEHLPELVRFYKPHEVNSGHNLFYTLSESLKSDAIKRIKEIQREAVKKTYEIMNDPDSVGPIPYFTVQLCETLGLARPTMEVMQ